VVLRADGLAKSFLFEDKRIHVLEDINLSLESGKSLSIRGDSGAGKPLY